MFISESQKEEDACLNDGCSSCNYDELRLLYGETFHFHITRGGKIYSISQKFVHTSLLNEVGGSKLTDFPALVKIACLHPLRFPVMIDFKYFSFPICGWTNIDRDKQLQRLRLDNDDGSRCLLQSVVTTRLKSVAVLFSANTHPPTRVSKRHDNRPPLPVIGAA